MNNSEPLPAAHRRNESDSRIGLLRRQHTDVAIARRSHLFGRSGSILGSDSRSSEATEPVMLTNFVSVADRGSLKRQTSLDSDLHLSSHCVSSSSSYNNEVAPDTPPFLHRRYPNPSGQPPRTPVLQVPRDMCCRVGLVFLELRACLHLLNKLWQERLSPGHLTGMYAFTFKKYSSLQKWCKHIFI